MNKGTVKWFNNQKGYGFISDEQGNDVFVHYSGLNMEGFKSLEEGAEVEYEVVTRERPSGRKRNKVIRADAPYNIDNQYHDVPVLKYIMF